ncbi:8592_t:CDS:2, partial [Gigaspora rosea]
GGCLVYDVRQVEGGLVVALYGGALHRPILIIAGYGLVVVYLSDCDSSFAEISDVHLRSSD